MKKLKVQEEHTRSPTHILVDEAQDLDRVQIRLIKRLSAKKPNVTFFLDYNQAIFSFKGALPDDIERIAPEALSLDHEFEAKYTECLKDLKTGEALIMMTTEGSHHVGIYKLPPRPLH